jgi:hypothetical protein
MFYPLGNVNKKLLNMAREIVALPKKKMVMFHSFWYVYQRVYPWDPALLPQSTARCRARWARALPALVRALAQG